ncbi:peptidyl-prolyl cis-trans isomerase c [Chrysochromulina tobinii]|uniref:Peptidyl-prolyl cis-trans isomerase n=1 Tax=Chrysochromulina tobinii TaxID=1460289 RepID=A0A0M0JYT4_9EUKA|nr:peptidyl-prolyl cis-trans isomerase c [Chrysochromulina tobinii]|eukprot:KOO31816.1 peptidyl-prolyl cis-trans isomerase c [Chrysochromulina sp. CCMP291]
MLGNSVLLSVLAFSPTLQRYGAAPTAAASAVGTRPCVATMGLFDAFKKGFENKDYSQSPGTYEQTNARASHVLVKTEAEALQIKNEIASNKCDFAEAASKYSTCSSSARGGKLGKFAPGVMAKEFDDVVFSLVDTGKLNPKNEAVLYEPKYAVGEVLGPVQTKFGWHLIKIETRYIADFDYRLKEEGVVEL